MWSELGAVVKGELYDKVELEMGGLKKEVKQLKGK